MTSNDHRQEPIESSSVETQSFKSFTTEVTDIALGDAGVKKVADVYVGSKIVIRKREKAKFQIDYNNTNRTLKFRRIVVWTPPRPKMPTRNLAIALATHKLSRGLPGVWILSEHSQDGWGAGTIYSMINRCADSLYNFSELLFDSIIVVHEGATETPFRLRSITPRARLIFVTSQDPTEDQLLNSDAVVRYDRREGLTDNLIADVAASLKHAVQIHTARIPTTYIDLKNENDGPTELPTDAALQLKTFPDSIIFILSQPISFDATCCFHDILTKIYTAAVHVLVPSYLYLSYDGILLSSDENKVRVLSKALSEGLRCRVVTSS